MTDSHDELASAYLDGEVSADERARVEGDPALLARVDELRTARDALAAAPVEAPPAATRDAAIRAALGATVVVDLARERARRRLRTLSVAAAALVAVAAVGLLVRAAGDSGQDTATTAAGTAAVEATTTAAAPSERAAADSALATAGGETLGSFANAAALVDSVRARLETPNQTKDATSTTSDEFGAAGAAGAAASCTPTPPATSTGSLLSGDALLEGRPVRFDVFGLADGTRQLVVTDATTCAAVLSQPL